MKTPPFKREYSIQIDNLLLNLFVDAPIYPRDVDLTSSLHTHSHAEIFACKRGKLLLQTKNETHTLLPGDAAIVPSGILHLKTPDADPESEWASAGFVCTECVSQSNRNFHGRISVLTETKNIVVYKNRQALCRVVQDITRSTVLDKEPSVIIDFLSELSKLAGTMAVQEIAASGKKKKNLRDMDRLLKLDYFIHQEFMNPLTNEKIAGELHIGERQLSRFVLNHYGTTLHALILRKRIQVAAKLLLGSTDTIENIALSVGFNNKMSFYREFKKTYGITPSQYRSGAASP